MRIHRHHLLEIILWLNSDGTFRKIINSKARLKELGIYDDWKLTINIPADEHVRMHGRNKSDATKAKLSTANKGKKRSAEVRAKLSKAKKGKKLKKLSAETRAKISAAQIGNAKAKGYKHSAEAKSKMSAAKKDNTNVRGRHWYNNGITSIMAIECPLGFTSGRIYKRKAT